MLRDSDLQEKIGGILGLMATTGNPTAKEYSKIYEDIRMAFKAPDPKTRKWFINHAKSEVIKAKGELEKDVEEPKKPKSAEDEEADRYRSQTFLSIENIDMERPNDILDPKVLKQRLRSVIKSLNDIGFADTTSVEEQTSELVKKAYETSDPLTRETILHDANEVVSRENYYSQTKWKLGFSFFMYFINNVGSLTLLMCFFILTSTNADKESRKSEKRKFHLAILVFISVILAFLAILYPFFTGISETELTSWIVCFDGLSGILSGVTLALLIARLDSKLLDLPHHLIVTMYFYAAFQPLFVVFELPGEIPLIIKTTVLFAVFATKIYFFLIITFVMQTGRMFTYFCCFPTLAKRVDSIFANQFVIVGEEKGDHFKFSILKQDRPIYTGKLHSSDETAFFKKLDELREAVKHTTRVRIKPTTPHQYKVEIVGKDNKEVICESIDLTMSKKEAEELKTDSKNSIPYCDARLVNKGKILQQTPNESIHGDPGSVLDITDSGEADHI